MPVLRKSFAANLREQNEKLKTNNKEEEHEKEANEAEVAVKEKQREIKGFPNIITTHNRIQIKKSAIEEAYSHKEPSKFYINMIHYLGLANNYARRAINGAKSHVKMVEEYPELHSETEEDPDMTEL
ncbi:hypothetical protein TSAR_002516 [Trichomalopsis sarcophagae]|uniref:Uncharacterized protein n=1 Tax=Trichomalopsis sarcophagae TaxID=543379 RepID=A0A232ED08_9HYME|nr:hypothetical protein TSAR_002516 [Trichomalopsis sarcophagae]